MPKGKTQTDAQTARPFRVPATPNWCEPRRTASAEEIGDDPNFAAPPADSFYFIVHGASLVERNILDGDMLEVKTSGEVVESAGGFVVEIWDDRADLTGVRCLVERVAAGPKRARLHFFEPDARPVSIPSAYVRVIGPVVSLAREVSSSSREASGRAGAAHLGDGAPDFPTSDDELEKLAPTRRDRWHLLTALEQLEQTRPLTEAEIVVGLSLTRWLSDEIGFVCEALGELIHEALDRPDPSTWRAAAAAWSALDITDQIHMHEVLIGTADWAYLHRFHQEPTEDSERVRRIREDSERDLAKAQRAVEAEAARAASF